MNPLLLPTTLEGKIDRIVEECGEVLQEIGKAGRFGLESAHPKGGLNNAALILSEMADLRHAISVLENELTGNAFAYYRGELGDSVKYVWTNELITAQEMRELIGEHDKTDDEFNAANKVIQVFAGEWHREGLEWRMYADPEWLHDNDNHQILDSTNTAA